MSEEKVWRYRVRYERAAGVGRTDGFSIEANGDDANDTLMRAGCLYDNAIRQVHANYPVLNDKKEAK